MEILFQSRVGYFLAEFFLKSSLILGLTLLVSFLSRKQPAAFRHSILVTAFIGLLILPFLMVFAPGWQTGLLPASWAKPVEMNISSAGAAVSRALYPGTETVPGAGDLSNLYRLREPAGPSGRQGKNPPFFLFLAGVFPYCLVVLWLGGLIFMLLKLILGLYGTSGLTRRGETMAGYPWEQLLLLFMSKTLLRKKVRLLRNHRVIVPMTWGVLEPVVVMPAESGNWPVDRCSSVLFHELSHVKRGDFPVRLLARISCSFYWFNPLCWVVYRKLKREQEKACDEMVLKAGIKPSTYASHLLQMRKAIDKRHYVPVPSPAIGMAGQSEFKERLLSILKKQLTIKEVKLKTKMILLITAVLAVAVIGTARPSQAKVAFHIDSENTVRAESTGALEITGEKAVEEEKEKKETAAVSEKTAEAKEEKQEKKCKEDKEKKKEKQKIKVLVKIKEIKKDKGKGEKTEVEKEVIVIPADCKIDIDELKLGKGALFISKDGDVFSIGEDKKEKVNIKIAKDCLSANEDDGPAKVIVLSKDCKGKHETTGIKADTITVQVLDEDTKDADSDSGAHAVFIGKKDGKKWVYKIKEKDCKHGGKVKDGEKDYERHIVIKTEEGTGCGELLEIAEECDKLIKVKKLEAGEGSVVYISKEVKKGKGYSRIIVSKAKIGKKQVRALEKAVSKLKKKLAGCCTVQSDIGSSVQKVIISGSEDEPGKKNVEDAHKGVEAFEQEFNKIVGVKKDKKS